MRLPLALLVALAAAPIAQAAYAPKLAIQIDPATYGQPVAITSTIRQGGNETPNKTVKVSFPAGFTTNQSTATICSAEQESARQCPETSKIGDAEAIASVLGLPVTLSGPVHYGGPQPDNRIKVIVFLDNASLNQHQTIEGFISLRPSDAGFDTVFDNLPDTLTTSFKLSFTGGSVALARTPVRCGTFPFKAHFTSQNGEQADSSSDVTITGCPLEAPRIGALGFTPGKPRAGKRAVVDFTLSEDAGVIVQLKSVKTGRRLLSATAAGKIGGNEVTVRIPRRARAGRYRASVTATDTDGMVTKRTARVTVRKHKR